MTAVTDDDRRNSLLTAWHAEIQNKTALLKDPEDFTGRLMVKAKEAHTQGVIDSDDLRELLELAYAANEWAVEELLTRELNGGTNL